MRHQHVRSDLRRAIFMFVIAFVAANGTLSQDRDGSPGRSSGIEHTNAILISQYMIRTGSEALLVTDPARIDEFVRLFRNNSRIPRHACGFHWIIQFRQGNTELLSFPHNEDCEIYAHNNNRIHSLLNASFTQILQDPKYFLLNVRLPASLTPDEAVEKLESGERKIFFFNGTKERLPSIKIRATAISAIPKFRRQWDAAEASNLKLAQDRLRDAIEDVRTTNTIVKLTKLDSRYSSFGGGKIEDRVETTIYYPFGTAVGDIRVPNKVEVLERKVPTYYIIQMVVKERFSDNLRLSLMSSNPFILDVRAFPDFQ